MRKAEAQVLLIDDVKAIVEELLTFMELHGIPAIGVQDLDEAMAALEAHPSIGVLACDVRLGKDSGLSIIPRIRDHPQLRSRPFRYLFITGDQLRPDPGLAMTDHMVLTKPVRPQVLIDVLRGLLGELEVSAQQEGG